MSKEIEILSELATLKAEYIKQLKQKSNDLCTMVKSFTEEQRSESTLEPILQMVHNLSGSGATYGFPVISERAKALERFIQEQLNSDRQINDFDYDTFNILFNNLYDYLFICLNEESLQSLQSDFSLKLSYKPEPDFFDVLILDHTDLTVSLLGDKIPGENIRIHSYYDLDQFLYQVSLVKPNIIILAHPDKQLINTSAKRIKEKINSNELQSKIICISNDDDFQSRLNYVNLGINYHFNHQENIGDLINLICSLHSTETKKEYRILIIDDDRELSNFYATILKSAGMKTKTIQNPKDCIPAIKSFEPELIISDIYMPEVSGLDLAAIIRQNYSYNKIPIIFLSAEDRFDKQLLARNMGGDDFITKPIDSTQLISSIMTRVEKARKQIELDKALKKSIEIAKNAEEKAIIASVDKDKFLANMSHEIRTPLNGILGTIQLLETEELSASAEELIRIQKSSSKILLAVINDILDLSKIESKNVTLEIIPVNIYQITTEIMELFSQQAIDKDLALLVMVDPKIPQEIMIDETRLKQVIVNLISNAIKFTEVGLIRLKIELIKLEDSKVNLHFSVLDTGIGLTKPQCQKLFNAFTQADSSTTRKFGGTGLGLTISQKLINIMGSKIVVDSKLNIGSNFHFELILPIGENSKTLENEISNCESLPKTIVISNNESILQFFSDEEFFHSEILVAVNEESILKLFQSINDDTYYIFDNRWSPLLCESIYSQLKKLKSFSLDRCIKLSNISLKNIPIVQLHHFHYSTCFFKFVNNLTDRKADKLLERSGLQSGKITKSNGSKLKVLLAEDNKVNQKIAKKFFDLLNLDSVIVENGLEAVKKIEESNFDIVFMDCQMPIMDGYEATKAIRDKVGKNLPIVAMTAHAMEDEKKKCFSSGMNDHIAKPIMMDSLVNIVKKYSNDSMDSSAQNTSRKEIEASDIMETYINIKHLDELLETVDQDLDFIEELVSDFENNSPEVLTSLKEAIDNTDYEKIEFFSHKIKGSAGNLGITKLVDLSQKLEEIGNRQENIDININQIIDAYDNGILELKSWIKKAS